MLSSHVDWSILSDDTGNPCRRSFPFHVTLTFYLSMGWLAIFQQSLFSINDAH
jgi:hypothetical protein